MTTTIIFMTAPFLFFAIGFYITIIIQGFLKDRGLELVIEELKVQIGGKLYPVDMRYEKHFEVLKFYNRHITEQKAIFKKINGRDADPIKDQITISNYIFFEMVYMFLKKSGAWPFRKPFRSANHMNKNILKSEVMGIVNFINKFVFDMPEGKEPGNEKLKQSVS